MPVGSFSSPHKLSASISPSLDVIHHRWAIETQSWIALVYFIQVRALFTCTSLCPDRIFGGAVVCPSFVYAVFGHRPSLSFHHSFTAVGIYAFCLVLPCSCRSYQHQILGAVKKTRTLLLRTGSTVSTPSREKCNNSPCLVPSNLLHDPPRWLEIGKPSTASGHSTTTSLPMHLCPWLFSAKTRAPHHCFAIRSR